MYLRKSILVACCFSLLATQASASNLKTAIVKSDLHGAWKCKHAVEQDGVRLAMDLDVRYIRNGKSYSMGSLKFKAPSLPEMDYAVSNSADWELDGKYLIETATEINIKNISHPEFDEKFNLGSLFPQNIAESSEILILNKSLLKVRSETDGTVYSCTRIPPQG